MKRYALAEHVFVCVNGEHVVLLDLQEDRYWALEATRTAGLGEAVEGWPVQSTAGATADPDSMALQTAEAIDVLRERGLLADSAPPGKDATPVRANTPVRELVVEAQRAAHAPRSGSWWAFLKAAVFAKLALRTWSFQRVISRAKRRKAAHGREAAMLDEHRARALVEAYARYRIFAFSSRDECLYDSLALLEFLARYGIYPDWVFAVQARPFAAHCWIQHGGLVFNDTVEHVNGYTPIMVV